MYISVKVIFLLQTAGALYFLLKPYHVCGNLTGIFFVLSELFDYSKIDNMNSEKIIRHEKRPTIVTKNRKIKY
jgi:hypothetical protein